MSIAPARSLHRLATGLAARRQLRSLPCICLPPAASATLFPAFGTWPRSSPAAAAACSAAARRHTTGIRLAPAASYSVVTGGVGNGEPGSTPGSSSAAAFKLIVYSKAGCHLCDGLKEKLEALLDRAAFMPCRLSGAELEVRDIATRPEWEAAYSMTIPVLAAAAPDGSREVEVPRPSPRLSADALQKHVEKFLAAQGLGQ
ncbi:hypothetical protein ACK3TF_005816 [Chlorella vulgaris]